LQVNVSDDRAEFEGMKSCLDVGGAHRRSHRVAVRDAYIIKAAGDWQGCMMAACRIGIPRVGQVALNIGRLLYTWSKVPSDSISLSMVFKMVRKRTAETTKTMVDESQLEPCRTE
jgi:hypothetical protein